MDPNSDSGDDVGSYIYQRALSLGIDPRVALRVYQSEGAAGYTGDGGSSFGPFQLHYAGINPNMPHPGLGDDFTKATGLDASDPSTWKQQVDFALQHASKNGWGAWMGAAKSGVSNFAGIGNSPSANMGGGDILTAAPTDYSASLTNAVKGAVAASAAAGIAPRPPQDILTMAPTDYGAPAPTAAAAGSQPITVETPVGSASGRANFTATPAGPVATTSPTSGSVNPLGSAMAANVATSASATSPASSSDSALTAPGGGLQFMNSIPVLGPGILAAGAGVNSVINGDSYADERAQQAQQMASFNAAHPYVDAAARVAGNVVGTAPLLAAAPAAFGMSTGLGAVPNALIAGSTNAGLNAIDTGIRGGSASDVERSAAIGAVGGAGGSLLGSGLNAAGRGLTGGTMATDDATLAAIARDKYGIPLTADQLGTNAGAKFVRSTSDRLPFSGSGSDIADTQTAFNAAVSRTIGENAPKLTPDVMTAAKARIGAVFDSVAANTTIKADSQFQNDLQSAMLGAEQELSPQELKPLNNVFDNVIGKISPQGTIDGSTYQAITRSNTPLGRALANPNSNISQWAGEIKDALDDALQRSAAPEDVQALSQAKAQYKNLKTIEPLVAKGGGDISPAGLNQAINGSRFSKNATAYGGGGDLGELANIGRTFLKEPQSSGTAERLATMAGLGAVTGGGNALLQGSLMGAAHGLGVVPAVLAANRWALNPALRSQWLSNGLINRSLPGAVSSGPATMPAIGALTSGAGNALLQQGGQ